MQTTPTGVSFTSGRPTCITQGEKDEANSKCPVETIRGLGAGTRALAAMSGRLAAFSPCELADLPVCPQPKCLDQATATQIMLCLAGTSTNPDFDCGSLYAYALAKLPYCARPSALTPIGPCLQPELVAVRDYCKSTGGNGPNKLWNAGCWAAMHDGAYWQQVLATPPCGPAPAPNRPMLQSPTVHAPAPVVLPAPPPEEETSLPPETTEAGMAGMWGILALLAAAGGGYYMYRRYKR
jgi:hypothetical protein